MKTAKVAAIGAASIFAMVALLLAYPAMATTNGSTANGQPVGSSPSGSSNIVPTPTALTVGQTITFTSTSGQFRVIGSPGETGVASGTLALSVTGAFKGGYSLSIASGTLTINGTSYGVASGSAQMGAFQAHLVGQGSLASATPGSFLFATGAHANFQGQTHNTLRLDVQVNGVEYGVLLLVTFTAA